MKPKFDDGYEDGYTAGLRKAAEIIGQVARWKETDSPHRSGMIHAVQIIATYIATREVMNDNDS